jgi:hypothetical protein
MCVWWGGDDTGDPPRVQVRLPFYRGTLAWRGYRVHRWLAWACIMPLAAYVRCYDVASFSAAMLGHDLGCPGRFDSFIVPCSGSDSEESS